MSSRRCHVSVVYSMWRSAGGAAAHASAVVGDAAAALTNSFRER